MIDLKSTIFSSGPGLLILLAFLFCISPSGAQAPGQLTGSPTDWDEIYITAPADITGWLFTPGITNERTGTLNVDATGSWELKVKNADSTTSGKMTKYNVGTATYDTGVKLASPMSILAAGGTGEKTLTTSDQVIRTGGATGQGGQDVTITFRQPVSWSDPVLDSGYKYRIVVTFTGSLTGTG